MYFFVIDFREDSAEFMSAIFDRYGIDGQIPRVETAIKEKNLLHNTYNT